MRRNRRSPWRAVRTQWIATTSERKGALIGKHGVRIKNAQEKGLPAAYSSGDEAVAQSLWATVEKGSQEIDIPLEKSPTPGRKDLKKK
ncbi:MAG: hypothetical protein WD069_10380 [Planctomycetales bacterium]